MVVPWQEEEQIKSLLTAKSMEQKEIDMREQQEMRKKETKEQKGLVSWSPRKNCLGGQRQPLNDWLPVKEEEHLPLTRGKQDKVTISSIWSDAPLNPWVPGKALAEASGSSKQASGSSKTPDSTSWTPGSPWIPGKALAEAASSKYQSGMEKTRA